MYIELIDDAKNDLFTGAHFFDSVMSDIESLNIYYGIHMKINGYHRMLTNRFPFAIYYKFTEKENKITIYAILDCRSNPEKILQRLK